MSGAERLADRVGVLVVQKRAMPLSEVHLATYVSTTLVAGGLLGANLRVNSIARDFLDMGVEAVWGVDPLVQFYFFRGWPLSPCMFCLIHGMRFRGAGFAVGLALGLNLAVAGLILMGVAIVGELLMRRQRWNRA
ncbi:hypothetical protein OJF2_41470 [Aquisphaera giovannonii]|uniref:Uncharacterized protein n=1 Tax=Aquisphaera giovannonii TaxID=406548 RepID=A0A5B9W5W1_9BACT|nr:hypothetical protein [Aquisphaera giovannonii]QEH35594.1 hypothetical protein OJF2_41470 [Aquisphaera giovannonii]